MVQVMILGVLTVLVFKADFAEARRFDCRQERLTLCTDPLRVITNNRDLGFATSSEDFDIMCPKLLGGLECISNYTRKCLDEEHRDFFHLLYAGTEGVIRALCLDDSFQREYLHHALCMRSVQSGYERCATVYQEEVRTSGQSDNEFDEYGEDITETSKKLCCSFQSYMECSQNAVRRRCGAATAVFTGSFLDKMAGSLIQGYCLAVEPEDRCSLKRSDTPGDSAVRLNHALAGDEVNVEVRSNSAVAYTSLGLILAFLLAQ